MTLALTGCEGTTEPPAYPANFSAVYEKIFAQNCITSSCHSTLSRRGNLILEKNDAYAMLVGVAPDNPTAMSKGLLRVDPGKPENSFLMIKLTGPREGEGDLMPQSSEGLESDAIEAIRTWIANGAKND